MTSANSGSTILSSGSSPGTQGDSVGPLFVHPFASVNVKHHVPMTLELKGGNFARWSASFLAMCGKFGVISHIDGTAPPSPADSSWQQADCCVRSWIFGSVAEAVLDMATTGTTQTARQLWVAIDGLFQANKAQRAIFLSHEFHSMTQGDSSIDDYCLRVKTTANKLRDVGHPVDEPQLVLNLLRGLNEEFAGTADHIAATSLTLTYARDQLSLKELRLANGKKVAAATALIAGSTCSCGGAGCRGQQQAPQQQPRGDGQRRNSGKKGGRKNGGGSGGGYGAHGGGFGASQRPSPAGPWFCMNPGGQYWAGAGGPPAGQPWRPSPGLLGSGPPQAPAAFAPLAPQQAHTAFAPLQYSPGPFAAPPAQAATWDQAGLIAALQQMSVQGSSPWVMDSGASSHMTSSDGILLKRLPTSISSILVGNGTSIPVTSHGHSVLATTASTFALNNVLVVPSIVQNLLSVRQFTRDNHCSIEFDAFGFSVKDIPTGRVILRCNSDGDLYTLQPSTTSALVAVSSTLWHQRLGHPAPAAVARLNKNNLLSCNNSGRSLCHSCQLGKHARLPFTSSTSHTAAPFELVHCDVWTSPVSSISGYSYYLVILDDFSHFCWTFPLRRKSDVHQTIVDFVAYVRTQFGLPVKCFQADNGTEFVNTATSTFLAAHGTLLRLSCPYTSAQNGKAERVLRTLNNSVRTLLLHASMPASYWAEALAVACYLLNRRPSSSIHSEIPYTRLYSAPPSYDHLRVFGCLCYPNLQATSAHKLAPRSAACVFLGYPTAHKGYRCLDLSTRRIIISRHVVFDESHFPFADVSPVAPPSSLDFLADDTVDTMPCSTNRAARPPPSAPAVAPFSSNVEQPPPSSELAGPGGRGPVPPSGPALPGGSGPVLPTRPPPSAPSTAAAGLLSPTARTGTSACACSCACCPGILWTCDPYTVWCYSARAVQGVGRHRPVPAPGELPQRARRSELASCHG